MTLRNQIFLVLSAVFGAVLVAILWVALSGTRHYLELQLASHAQETATTLSMNLGVSLGQGDRILARTQVQTIFDRGDFKRIEVFSADRQSISLYELPEKVQGVPLWFVKLFQMDAPAGEAFVGSGWKQLGKVIVVSQPTFAYQYLWRTTLQLTAWLFALWVLALGLMQLVLHFVLTPLRAIERSAKKVQSKQFEQIEMRPRAPELARVVVAMNDMSRRVSDMLESEAQKISALHRLSYEDELTGLANRQGLELHLTELLQGDRHFQMAAVIAVELDDMRLFNRAQGFNAGRAIMQLVSSRTRETLPDQKSSFLSRSNEFSFAFLVLEVSDESIRRYSQSLHSQLREDIGTIAPENAVRVHVGVSFFQLGDSRSDVFARADLSVESARQTGANGYAVLEDFSDPYNSLGSFGWRTLIQSALDGGRLQLLMQPVVLLRDASSLLHLEGYARLNDADGKLIPAAKFLPMAARHQLMPLVDKAIVNLVFDRLRDPGLSKDCIALNLSPQSVADAPFMAWLAKCMTELGTNANRIAVEISEFGALRDVLAVRRLRDLVRSRGGQFGYDNFGLGADAIALIREVPPDYVKLSGTFVANLEVTAEDDALLRAFVKLAHSLEVTIVALRVENETRQKFLMNAGVDAGQGFLWGAPS